MNVRIALATLLVILAMTVIAGGLFIYYAAVYQPNQMHAQATATTVAAIATGADAFLRHSPGAGVFNDCGDAGSLRRSLCACDQWKSYHQ